MCNPPPPPKWGLREDLAWSDDHGPVLCDHVSAWNPCHYEIIGTTCLVNYHSFYWQPPGDRSCYYLWAVFIIFYYVTLSRHFLPSFNCCQPLLYFKPYDCHLSFDLQLYVLFLNTPAKENIHCSVDIISEHAIQKKIFTRFRCYF